MKFKNVCFLFSLVFLLMNHCERNSTSIDLPQITKESKPWTYWWWMGSAVDQENLTRRLAEYHKAGIGGVHIIPIYGVKSYEDRYIDYLSPQWMAMLAHTTREARRLGMGVDMTTGTGWPFGGSQVTTNDAAKLVLFEKYTLKKGNRLKQPITCANPKYERSAKLQVLMAYSDKKETIDLTEKVDASGNLDWIAPDSNWKLYAVFQAGTGQQVKRAAPGAEGNVMNYFSASVLSNYLARFDTAFANYSGERIRGFYNDSYEVYGANWTDNFFGEFKSRRGYDLHNHLPALLGEASQDTITRIKCDYRETISDLLLEEFTIPWVKWSHEKGCITRNEAHGSPANILDLYAAADVPETEIFGPGDFKIPGLRIDPDFPDSQNKTNPLMLKFASSAAHVAGRRLVASESCTWLGEHFKVALSQAKPEIDQLLVAGINHVFFHGITYSPDEAQWPGWLFYASTNFGPSNSFWRDLPALNAYITTCQSVLQAGQPDNDILIYFPIYDIWHEAEEMLIPLSVHNIKNWLYMSEFYRVTNLLWQRGYTFDYISDHQIAGMKVMSEALQIGNSQYQTLIVPNCMFMRLETFKYLLKLAEEGATVIFYKNFPQDVPGFNDYIERRSLLNQLISDINLREQDDAEFSIGNGKFMLSDDLESMLQSLGIQREQIADWGIQFIRRKHDDGHYYFVTNLGNQNLDDWVTLGTTANSVLIFDPIHSKKGFASVRNTTTQVYLQLKPGESRILKTFGSKQIQEPKWKYLELTNDSIDIRGTWEVNFIDGGPKLPAGFQTDSLISWTKLGNEDANRFAGTAVYKISFSLPTKTADEYILNLGRVCESARIKVNDHVIGILFSHPFEIAIGKWLSEGKNSLAIEVTNLTANRIADLDKNKVDWKKFHDINFVNIKYKKFDASDWPLMDSGLLGPVRIYPVKFK